MRVVPDFKLSHDDILEACLRSREKKKARMDGEPYQNRRGKGHGTEHVKDGMVQNPGVPPTSLGEIDEEHSDDKTGRYVAKQRNCLKCGKSFLSAWCGRRVCDDCRCHKDQVVIKSKCIGGSTIGQAVLDQDGHRYLRKWIDKKKDAHNGIETLKKLKALDQAAKFAPEGPPEARPGEGADPRGTGDPATDAGP